MSWLSSSSNPEDEDDPVQLKRNAEPKLARQTKRNRKGKPTRFNPSVGTVCLAPHFCDSKLHLATVLKFKDKKKNALVRYKEGGLGSDTIAVNQLSQCSDDDDDGNDDNLASSSKQSPKALEPASWKSKRRKDSLPAYLARTNDTDTSAIESPDLLGQTTPIAQKGSAGKRALNEYKRRWQSQREEKPSVFKLRDDEDPLAARAKYEAEIEAKYDSEDGSSDELGKEEPSPKKPKPAKKKQEKIKSDNAIKQKTLEEKIQDEIRAMHTSDEEVTEEFGSQLGPGAVPIPKRIVSSQSVVGPTKDGGHDDFVTSEIRPCFPDIKNTGQEVPMFLNSRHHNDAYEVPACFNKYLRAYQREGVQRMFKAFDAGHGILLGDDMGLGKTVQVIALLVAILRKQSEKSTKPDFLREDSLFSEAKNDPVLIVVPANAHGNWMSELKAWSHIRVADGGKNSAMKTEALRKADSGAVDVVLTTYSYVRQNTDEFLYINSKKEEREWMLIVCDEVHCLGKPTSQITKQMKRFTCPCKIGMTGTVLQNNLQELWSIFDWIVPGCLGDKSDFNKEFTKKIEAGHSANANDAQLASKRKAQDELNDRISHIYFRRTKEIIKDQLPKKIDLVLFCPLTTVQEDCYRNLLASEEIEWILRRNQQCDCKPPWLPCCGKPLDMFVPGRGEKGCGCHASKINAKRPSGKARKDCCYKYTRYHLNGQICTCASVKNGSSRRRCMKCHCTKKFKNGRGCAPLRWMYMAVLTYLQKTANHLGLMVANKEAQDQNMSLQQKLGADVFKGHPELLHGRDKFLKMSDPEVCCKMKALRRLMANSSSTDKWLLFSYSTQLLNLMESVIKGWGLEYLRLDGSTSKEKRTTYATQFNTDRNIIIFLISTRAGGVSLNLTGANKVIIFDPNWNPALDLQAQDRAFRLGQKRDVTVYRLIAAGTIEEHVYNRQLYKQGLSNTATTNENQPRFFSPQDDLYGLDNLLEIKKDKTKKAVQDIGYEETEFKLQVGNVESDERREQDADLRDPLDEYDIGLILEEYEKEEPYIHKHSAVLKPTQAENLRVNNAVLSRGKITRTIVRKSPKPLAKSPSTQADPETIVLTDVENDLVTPEKDSESTTTTTVDDSHGNSNYLEVPLKDPTTIQQQQEGEEDDYNNNNNSTEALEQVKAMTYKFGFLDDVVEFARHVLSLSSLDRQKLLDKFYDSVE
eukprot:m.84872 g.84872  ORF g.84872 m.84872 type:complete len:1200 (-) comp12986_c0_seq2:65-3664(-)